MAALLFRSTNGRSPAVNLRQAVLSGIAPDRGLYFPESFPVLTADEINGLVNLPYDEISFRILSKYTKGVISDDELATLCHEAYDFDVPLEKIYDRVYTLRSRILRRK